MISLKPPLITEHHSVLSLNDLAREASPSSRYLRPARDEGTTYTVGGNCSRVDGNKRTDNIETRGYSPDASVDPTEARNDSTLLARAVLPRNPKSQGVLWLVGKVPDLLRANAGGEDIGGLMGGVPYQSPPGGLAWYSQRVHLDLVTLPPHNCLRRDLVLSEAESREFILYYAMIYRGCGLALLRNSCKTQKVSCRLCYLTSASRAGRRAGRPRPPGRSARSSPRGKPHYRRTRSPGRFLRSLTRTVLHS